MAEEENLTVVRRFVEYWNARDLEGGMALVHDDIVYVNAPSAVEPGTRTGVTELAAVMRAQWDTLSDGQLELIEVVPVGERVFAVVSVSVSYGGSAFAQRFGSIYTFRDGLLAGVEQFDDIESGRTAFEAAG